MRVPHELDQPHQRHYQDGPTLEGGTESFSPTRPPQFNEGNLASNMLSVASGGLAELFGAVALNGEGYVHIPPSFVSGETTTSEETVRLGPASYERETVPPALFPLSQNNLDVHSVVDKPRSGYVQSWLREQAKSTDGFVQFEKREVSESVKPSASRVSHLSDEGSWVDVRPAATDSMDVSGAGARFDDVAIPANKDLDFDV